MVVKKCQKFSFSSGNDLEKLYKINNKEKKYKNKNKSEKRMTKKYRRQGEIMATLPTDYLL